MEKQFILLLDSFNKLAETLDKIFSANFTVFKSFIIIDYFSVEIS